MKQADVNNVLTTFNKAIDRVLAQPPGPERWKEAVNLWLTQHPSHPLINQQVIEQNRKYRETLIDKFGTTGDKNSSFRAAMSFPAGAKAFIEMSDPQAFKTKENRALLFKTFPGYARTEKY